MVLNGNVDHIDLKRGFGTMDPAPAFLAATDGGAPKRQWLRPATWIAGLAWCAGFWAAAGYGAAMLAGAL